MAVFAMRKLTIDEFSDKTALLPWLVAETVISSRQLYPDDHRDFVNSCDARTVHHYNTHEQFRKYMDGVERREWLYSFVNHWFDSYIKNPQEYLSNLEHRKKKVSPLKIKATVYRNQEGFSLYGGGHGIFGISIFVDTREKAELLREAYKVGKDSHEIISGIMKDEITEIS